MDRRSTILTIFAAVAIFYAIISFQWLLGTLVVVIIFALWFTAWKIIPVVDTYLKNIQRLSEDTAEIKKLLAANNAELHAIKERIDNLERR
jgi:hypothetical protein